LINGCVKREKGKEMDIVIKVIGMFFALIGVVYLLKPNIIKWLMEFFKQGRRLYIAGVLRFAFAIIFLIGARECDITWVIITFGVLFLISGLLIFTLGLDRLRSMLEWYQQQSNWVLRFLASVTLILGAVIIYSA